MSKFLALILSMVAFCSYCGEKSSALVLTNTTTIKIDEEHRMNNRPAGVQGEAYRIPPSSTIAIDADGYKFDVLVGFKERPLNSIQVVQDKLHQFTLTWEEGKTHYELSKDTLKPVSGSQPFESFKAGDEIMLGIGIVYEPQKFALVWAGLIKIR